MEGLRASAGIVEEKSDVVDEGNIEGRLRKRGRYVKK